jgi:gliding motility-associated-like protein
MKLLIILFCVLSISTYSLSQLSICLGNDTTLCSSQSININQCGSSTTIGGVIMDAPLTAQTSGGGSLTDDVWSNTVNIGFNFSFYGINYTQCIIGSNGLISFDISKANGYCEYSLTGVTPLPNSTLGSSLNAIMVAYQDLNPSVVQSGPIHYQTIGTAPNRKFVVLYKGISGFSCDATTCTYAGLILNETSNTIEIHIGTRGICDSWNGGLGIEGIQNLSGSNAVIVPGRNVTAWSANQDGQLFTPTAPGNTTGYVNTVIPYVMISSTGSNFLWADTDGNTYPYNNGVLNVPNPSVGTVGYFLSAGSCSNAVGTVSDTTFLTVLGGDLLTDSTRVSCPGGNDGTATINHAVPGTYTYLWNDPLAQTTQTAIGLSAGTYTCTVTNDTGCTESETVTVTEIPGMVATLPLVTDVTCNSGNDGVIQLNITQGTAPYTYVWDQSASTTNTASDLVEGLHSVTITDANGCTIDTVQQINEPLPLSITSLTSDTIVCPENEITLHASGSGGSSQYIFVWTENGIPIGTGDSIVVDPSTPSTVYCVTLSETCGSPFVDSCLNINFPTPIIPNLLPNIKEACVPGFFEFQNTSSNPSEIATTIFHFNDLSSTTEVGADSTSHLYETVQTWNIGMTVTSIYGCIYDTTIMNVVTTNPLPIAKFGMSANPTSIFETEILMQDNSSANTVSWLWNSPFSTPNMSTTENPLFSFPEGVEGEYPITLYVTSEQGCVDSVVHILSVNPDIIFYAPNAFTPNGDEFNNTWIFHTAGIDEYDFQVTIFNRWGQVIFQTNDVRVGWDGTFQGKLVQTDIYTWTATVKDLYTDKRVTFNGSINVMR